MNGFLKRFKSDIRSIGLLGTAVFVALALLSYNPKDPSFNSMGQQGLNTLNYCGLIGSFLADLLYQIMGLPAWLMIAGLFQASILSFKGKGVEFKNLKIIWMALLICSLSALASIYWPDVKVFENQIYLGGLLGLGLATGLIKILNSVGAQVLLWAMTAMMSVFCFEFSVNDIVMDVADFLRDRLDRFQRSQAFKNFKWPEINFAQLPSIPKKKKSEEPTTETLLVEKKNLIPAPQLKLSVQEDVAGDIEELEVVKEDEPNEGADEEVTVSAYEPPARRKVTMPSKTPRRVAN